LEQLPLGTKVHLGGSAVVELTGLRTPCSLIDRFQRGLRTKMVRNDSCGPKFKCGVFGVVLAGGKYRPAMPPKWKILLHLVLRSPPITGTKFPRPP
jgi:MOSC domain-containing protein YiiM